MGQQCPTCKQISSAIQEFPQVKIQFFDNLPIKGPISLERDRTFMPLRTHFGFKYNSYLPEEIVEEAKFYLDNKDKIVSSLTSGGIAHRGNVYFLVEHNTRVAVARDLTGVVKMALEDPSVKKVRDYFTRNFEKVVNSEEVMNLLHGMNVPNAAGCEFSFDFRSGREVIMGRNPSSHGQTCLALEPSLMGRVKGMGGLPEHLAQFMRVGYTGVFDAH